MNIRKHTVRTHIPGYDIFLKQPGFFGQKSVWVEGRWEDKSEYEYLNPETAKWEPIPEKRETIYTKAPESKIIAGQYSWE